MAAAGNMIVNGAIARSPDRARGIAKGLAGLLAALSLSAVEAAESAYFQGPPRDGSPPDASEVGEVLRLVERHFAIEPDRTRMQQACVAQLPGSDLGAPAPGALEELPALLEQRAAGRGPDEARRLARVCIEGMLQVLDRLLFEAGEPDAVEAPDAGDGKPVEVGVGIGFTPMMAEGGAAALIDRLARESPALRAGVHVGDRLVAIDGQPLAGLAPAQIDLLLRGPPGTRLTLRIERTGLADALEFAFARHWPSLELPTVAPVGGRGDLYVRVPTMRPQSANQALAGIDHRLADSGQAPLGGVILDLRGNQGGLAYAAWRTAALFLPDDAVVVELRGRKPVALQTVRARADQLAGTDDSGFRHSFAARPAGLKSVPLAVLTDSGTAGGAVLVADILRRSRGAVLVGAATSDIGTIKQTFQLSGGKGALRLVTQVPCLPSGACLPGRRLVPDHAVTMDARPGFDPSTGPDNDPVLEKALQVLHANR